MKHGLIQIKRKSKLWVKEVLMALAEAVEEDEEEEAVEDNGV